jgi:hypothetical protein
MEERPRYNFIELSPGLGAPKVFTFRVEEERGYSLEADVVYEQPVGGRMGHFVCDRLTVKRREDGQPVTTRSLSPRSCASRSKPTSCISGRPSATAISRRGS